MLDLGQVQKQTQTIHADQVLALSILSFSNQELESFLQEEYYDNPLLDQSLEKSGSDNLIDSMFREFSQVFEPPAPKERTYGDDYYDREQYTRELSIEDPYTLERLVTEQLDPAAFSETEWSFILSCIEHTDEKGFLSCSPACLFNENQIAPSLGAQILNTLQHLEPAGLFSENLEEYLIFQLKERNYNNEKLFQMIRFYLPEVITGKLSTATRELSVSSAQVKSWLQLISSLNPKPMMNIDAPETSYLIPDLVVNYVNHTWEIKINDGDSSRYATNSYYAEMLPRIQDPELKQYFLEKHRRANFILECVEKRRSTLEKTVRCIMEYQESYFLSSGDLRPMTLGTIASLLEMNESTVSRAIKDKTIQYKSVFPIKDLFSVSSGADEDLSQKTILKTLETLIREENKKKPLSDSKLSLLLSEQGIEVSRRAVTKYREKLGIPDSRHRF